MRPLSCFFEIAGCCYYNLNIRHCWNDSWERAEEWLKAFPRSVLGFTNLLSEKNKRGELAREVVRRTPMSRMILETDAPYFKARSQENLMGVEGQPPFCHPIHLIDAAETLAKVKGMTVEEVLAQSYCNITRVYKLQRKAVRGEGKEIAEDILRKILKDTIGQWDFEVGQMDNSWGRNLTWDKQSASPGREELNVRMMSLGVACEVMVSTVESPDKLYLQMAGSKLVQLNRLNYRLTEFNASVENRKNLTVDEVVVGMLVASQFGSKEDLCRARVVAVKGGHVELFYVDFGDWDWRELSSLSRLPGQFLDLPHQAVPCCLAGLSPKGRLWSEEAIDHLMELTQAGSGQVLWARLMDWKMEDSLGLLPCVELFIGNCSVNTSLVQIGHAIFQ